MTVSQKISQWFEDECPYLLGVALYQQTGGTYPISAFLGYETATFVPDNVENRLQYALRSYLNEHPLGTVIQKQETNTTQKAPSQDKTITEEPPAIVELRDRAKTIHKRHSEAKGRLNLMAKDQDKYSDNDRYKVAHKIMSEINPQLDGIYDRIRKWQETGELPAATSNGVVEDTVQKMLRRESLKPRISRLKKWLKGDLEAVKRKDYEKELLEKEVELKEICEELGL